MLYMALNCELIEDTSVVTLVEREYMVVMCVLEQVSLIVADTILSVRFFNTSTLLSSSLVTEMMTTVVEVEVELTTLELELTLLETRLMKKEQLMYLMTSEESSPYQALAPMTVELLTMTVLLVLVVELSEVEMTRDSLVEV